jgi:hypothetical protein
VHSGVHAVREALVDGVCRGHIQSRTRIHSAQRVNRFGHKWDVWEVGRTHAKNIDILGAGLREAQGENARLAIARECIDVVVETLTIFHWRKNAGDNCRCVLTLDH